MKSDLKKNVLNVFLLLFGGLLFQSCQRTSPDVPGIPEALQSNSGIESEIEYFSKGRGYSNLVDELFEELITKNAQLKDLVDTQRAMLERIDALREPLFAKDGQNTQYYNDARQHASSITDSTTSQKAMAMIDLSENRYKADMAARDALAERLQHARQQLDDELRLLKIRLTLPQIEDFQSKTQQTLQPIDQLLADQKTLLQKMRQLPSH